MDEFAIKSYRVVTPEHVKAAFVLIKNGVITDVVETLPESFFVKVIDVGDKLLMPGVTDPHVHINEPGRTGWEGFETATNAASAGGITT
jgi:allantoinase